MYRVYYHNLVLKEDIKKIPKNDLEQIFKAIEKKLFKDPLNFGKPLRKELKGYFKLRIGQYRTVYLVEDDKVIVYILKIGLKKDLQVYLEAAKRLRLFDR